MTEIRSLKRAASFTGDDFSAKASKLTTSTPKIKRISLNFVANRKKSTGQSKIFRSESNVSLGSNWSDVFNMSNSSISSQFSTTSSGAPPTKGRRSGNLKKIGEKLEKTKARLQNRFDKISKNSSISKKQSPFKTTQHPKSIFSTERPILAKHQNFLEDCVIWEEKYD